MTSRLEAGFSSRAWRRRLRAAAPALGRRTERLARRASGGAHAAPAHPPRPVRRRSGGRGRAARGARRRASAVEQAAARCRLRDHARPGGQPLLRHPDL